LREELKIEPGVPGYRINFDYVLAKRVLEMFGGGKINKNECKNECENEKIPGRCVQRT